jgi:hypothetical protein
MTLQLFLSEFPYKWGKFDFLFYSVLVYIDDVLVILPVDWLLKCKSSSQGKQEANKNNFVYPPNQKEAKKLTKLTPKT